MKRPLIVGVVGGGRADEESTATAYRLGALIAQQGWVLLNGGRNAGIMAASSKGAADHGGLTVGILPDADLTHANESVAIPICTGMGSARNTINVLSSRVVIACRGGAGTLSEIALALKHERPVITLNFQVKALFEAAVENGVLLSADSPEEVIRIIRDRFDSQ